MKLIKQVLILILVSFFVSGCMLESENKTKVDTAVKIVENQERLTLNETTNNNNSQKQKEGEELKQTPDPKESVIPTIVNEDNVIINVDNVMVLVNKENTLPSNYKPEKLVIPNIPFYFEEDIPKRYLKEEAAIAIEGLFEKAKEDQIQLIAASGYRSYERQSAIFHSKAKQVGEVEANKVVAFPGQSEHQTGLAMDVTTAALQFKLEEELGNMEEGIWLKNNAHLYGFIIRYPKEKEKITGYQYEPWHIRYVGENVAKEIYENNLTLEEYIALNNNQPVNKHTAAIKPN